MSSLCTISSLHRDNLVTSSLEITSPPEIIENLKIVILE
jgi:hypothetical protein